MPLLPQPYPDEIIGSIIARCHAQTGLPIKRLLALIYENRRNHATFWTTARPARFGALCGLNPYALLARHSVLPYATAYMPLNVRAWVWDKALNNMGQGVESMASVIKNASRGVRCRRMCLICAREDLGAYGESYWRRSHQLPGVDYCWRHKCSLAQANTELSASARSAILGLPHETPLRTRTPGLAEASGVLVARRSSDVLTDARDASGQPRATAAVYRRRAIAAGYRLPSGDVAAIAIARDLRDLFGDAYLRDAGCTWHEKAANPWPALMVREGVCVPFSPIRHILLGVFLDLATGATVNVPASYRRPGPRRRDYGRLDQEASDRFWEEAAKFACTPSATVENILAAIGVWSTFRHDRSNFPRLSYAIREFRQSQRRPISPLKPS